MKKLLLLFAVFLAAVLPAKANTATFNMDATKFSGSGKEYSATYTDAASGLAFVITFNQNTSLTQFYKSSTDHIRVYQNAVLGITAPADCKLTKVSWTTSGSSYNKTFKINNGVGGTTSTYTGNTASWSADASKPNVTTLELLATAQIRVQSISIVYETTRKTPATLSWSLGEVEYTFYKDLTWPSLTADPAAALADVMFSSDDTAAATVAADGTVTPVAEGATVIRAAFKDGSTYEGAAAAYALLVYKFPLELSFPAENLDATAWTPATKLKPVLRSAGEVITNTEVKTYCATHMTYTSSDENVVTVAANGDLTIKDAGEAIITITIEGNDKIAGAEASYMVTVAPDLSRSPVTVKFMEGDAEIASKTVTGAIDGTLLSGISVSVDPIAADEALVWSSTNPDVAAYDAAAGAIRMGSKMGTTTISAVITNHDKYQNAGASLEITWGCTGEDAALAWSAATSAGRITRQDEWTAPTLSGNATDAVTYSSSDPAVATVDPATGEVTFAKVGSTTITATLAGHKVYADASASYELTVKYAKDYATLKFDTKSILTHDGEVPATATLTVTPEAAAFVTFSSDNELVALVNAATGAVKFTGEYGKATITATLADAADFHDASASYTVEYAANLLGWNLVSDVTTLRSGDIVTFVAKKADAEVYYAIGAAGEKNYSYVNVNLAGDVLTPAEGMSSFQININEQGYISFYDPIQKGFLRSDISNDSKNKNNYLQTASDEYTARVTINASSEATIVLAPHSSRNRLQWNAQYSIFSCYSSDQQPVYIFVKGTAAEDSATLTLNLEKVTGVWAHAPQAPANKVVGEVHIESADGSAVLDPVVTVMLDGVDATSLDGLPYASRGYKVLYNGVPVKTAVNSNLTLGSAEIIGASFFYDENDATLPVHVSYKVRPVAGTNVAWAVEKSVDGTEWTNVTEWNPDGTVSVVVPNVGSYTNGVVSLTPGVKFSLRLTYPFWVNPLFQGKLAAEGEAKLQNFAGAPAEFDVAELAASNAALDPANSEVSGIVDVTADSSAQYYTLQGVKVSGKPAAGLYIRLTANGAAKVMVK